LTLEVRALRETAACLISSVLLVAILGTVSAFTFFVVATMNGFRIPLILFIAPLLVILGIVAGDLTPRGKYRIPINASLGRLFQTSRYGLASIILVAGILHLTIVFRASYYPDEYGVWALLNTHPWLNLAEFLRRYDVLAGLQRVHPPIGFLLMALGYSVLGSIEGARLVSAVFALATIPTAYWLASMFLSRKNALIVSAVFALMPQTIVFLSLALTDTYVFFFGLLSLSTYASAVKERSRVRLLASGVCLGLAFWSKLAIPILWAFVIMLAGFLLPWGAQPRRVIWAAICAVIGVVIYGLWYFVSPVSFELAAEMLLRIMLIKRPLSPISSISVSIFSATNANLSYQDLLLQLPVWFTPLVILFVVVGIYAAFREKERQASWMGLWALVPLLALIPNYRDVRYLLMSSIPAALLVVSAIGRVRYRRRAIFGVVLFFLILGSVSLVPIVEQQYYGVREAAWVVSDLGISRNAILTNALAIQFYLSDANLIDLSSYGNESLIIGLLSTGSVSAVVIIHNLRGPWIAPQPSIITLLRAHFTHRIANGLSDFSWYEVLY